MKKLRTMLTPAGIAIATVTMLAPAALPARDLPAQGSIAGDYLEARTAEVFVGYCLANSEVGLAGREGTLVWSVREGDWEGVPLAGLSVVAVVEAEGTLGDPVGSPVATRSLILVDERASPRQRSALVGMARSMAGPLLANVAAVEGVPIAVERDESARLRTVRAGDIAALAVRERRHDDGLCGNEDVYYRPFVELQEAQATYTLRHEFSGLGLGGSWKSPEKSSSWSGSFVR